VELAPTDEVMARGIFRTSSFAVSCERGRSMLQGSGTGCAWHCHSCDYIRMCMYMYFLHNTMWYYGISQEGSKAFTQQRMRNQRHMPTHRALMGKLGGENRFIHARHTLHISAKWVPHRGFPGEGPFGLITANVTAWSSAMKWLEEDGDSFELLCIQEHHLSSSNDINVAKANGLVKGFQSCLAPALDTGLGDGTTGGVGFIWPHHVRITCPGDIIECHWGNVSST
jgi:hypothetical protein